MTELLQEILEYLPGPRNGPYEHELACKRLRSLMLYDRLEILRAVLPVDITFTLKIAKNAVVASVSDREFVRPGLLAGDYKLMKYYLRYGADNAHGLGYLETLAAAEPKEYVRLSWFAYYYPLYLGRNAKLQRAWFKNLIAELNAGGHLEFDAETWEGGPNDIEWFVDVDKDHRVWFPPIRKLIDKHLAETAPAVVERAEASE